MAHAVVGILERQADEGLEAGRNQIVLAPQRVPWRDPVRIFLRQRQRHGAARLHLQRIGNRRPDILPGEDVAIGDVEGFVARRRRFAGPGDRARQQIDVDRLRHPRGTAGIIQRPALLAQHGGIDAERRDQIHRAAHRLADDQDRPQNAPVPGLALLQFAQKILLRPVEIRLLVHFRAAFARRHDERTDVNAIGLGALQQRDVPKLRRGRLERGHQVAQHQIVGADLVRIAPAVDQVRRFIERGIDEVGGALQFGGDAHALRRVGQVDRNVAGAVGARAACAATAPQPRIRQRAEVPQGGISHQPGRARDHDLLVRPFQAPAAIFRLSLADDRRTASACVLAFGRVRADFADSTPAIAHRRRSQLRASAAFALDYRSPIGPSCPRSFVRQNQGFERPDFNHQSNVGHRRNKKRHQDRCPSSRYRHKRGSA